MAPAALSPTDVVGRAALDGLKRLAAQRFNLTCSFSSPHPPMVVTDPYHRMYDPAAMPIPASIHDDMENSPYRDANRRLELTEFGDEKKLGYMISNYYGLIKEIDDWVGRILTTLDEQMLTDNTLVVFTSDHGEMLGAHGMREKNVFYEESVRVPLLMRFPGRIAPGRVVRAPVSQIDLFATILDYMQVAGDHPSHGASLRPLIEGGGTDRGPVISEWHLAPDSSPSYMVVDGHWKLLLPRHPEVPVIDALYDLERDPHEMDNLLGKNPRRGRYRERAEGMRGALVSWLRGIGSSNADGVARIAFS
jgi:arylsulfatase A-like enzyme